MRSTLLLMATAGLVGLGLNGCAGTEKSDDGGEMSAGNRSAATSSDGASKAMNEGQTSEAALTPPVGEPAPPPAPFAYELASANLPETGMWKCDPVFEDINEDGHPDLIAHPRLGDGARVWLGDGKGGWRESSNGLRMQSSCGGGIDVADLNGDGHLDLAIADHCNGVFIYFGDGAGGWTEAVAGLYPEDLVMQNDLTTLHVGAEDLCLGDVNGDGHHDIVAGSSDEGGINVYLGDGTGIGWSRQSVGLPTTGWANRIELADMDGDGRLDIVATYADGPRIYRNAGDNRWMEDNPGMPSPMIRGLFRGLAVEDMDNDGRLDVVVANWVDGPEVYYQQEDGGWRKSPDVFKEMYGGAQGLDVADLNGDGELDIAVTGRLERQGGFVRGVYVLINDGEGGWTFIPNCGLPTTGLAAMDGVVLGDVDHDGRPDLCAGSGLITENVREGRTAPVLRKNLLVWLQRPAKGAEGKEGS